jgi:hypothetical protein
MFMRLTLNEIRWWIEMMNRHQFCFQWKKNVNLFQIQRQRTKWTSKTILFATKILKTLFRMRTLILLSEQESCQQKNLCLQYKQKLFMHDSIQDYSRSKSSTKNSRKMFRLIVEKIKNIFSKKTIKKIVLISINFTKLSIELRIVLKILQKFDQFAQKEMTQAAQTITVNAKFDDDSKINK